MSLKLHLLNLHLEFFLEELGAGVRSKENVSTKTLSELKEDTRVGVMLT
jgi:hypothetical protein